MHPILFEVGPITIYSYGACIAVGTVLAFLFAWWQGRKQFGLSFNQINTLAVLLILASFVGGKIFLFFESPDYYINNPMSLVSGGGFVFYGSLLLCIPTMLLYFRYHKLPIAGMLDIMAMVTCIVHGFGRIGCFNAGCCHGTETDSFLGVVFTDARCLAPLGKSLHPVQLYESVFIFSLLLVLWWLHRRKQFNGQVFLVYLMGYAVGRSILELLRGDEERGFVVEGWLSHSQFISLVMFVTAAIVYARLKAKAS